ncbi:MAG: NUDIX domain-containing protein [Candidatus Gracilibacteria bacterium]|nr:NUDIX domain-containing protein [Candidatus Gracilibacteria bacterium]
MKTSFTKEDLNTREAIGVVIYDDERKVLIQDHVKLDFFTIPIGKIKEGEEIEEVIKQEVFDETNLKILSYRKIGEKIGEYDYDGVMIRIKTHIFEVLEYEGKLINKEEKKHRSMRFMDTGEIRGLSKISDATKYFLSTLDI